ncbi:unnamed protein product, partial [Discosporangium mesarthrocarpum]
NAETAGETQVQGGVRAPQAAGDGRGADGDPHAPPRVRWPRRPRGEGGGGNHAAQGGPACDHGSWGGREDDPGGRGRALGQGQVPLPPRDILAPGGARGQGDAGGASVRPGAGALFVRAGNGGQ